MRLVQSTSCVTRPRPVGSEPVSGQQCEPLTTVRNEKAALLVAAGSGRNSCSTPNGSTRGSGGFVRPHEYSTGASGSSVRLRLIHEETTSVGVGCCTFCRISDHEVSAVPMAKATGLGVAAAIGSDRPVSQVLGTCE